MAIQFKPKLAPSIATLIVLPILMSLGFWQLERAELKQQQLDNYMARSEQKAMLLTAANNLDAIKIADAKYRKFEVAGRYDVRHNFLIDNRVHQSQVGFYVVTPFVIENSKSVILVNRGWLKGKRYRADLPDFITTDEKITLKGTGYVPSTNFFAVDNVKISNQSFPVIIQNIDFTAIREVLKMDLYPFILRLDPEDKTGFVRDWQVVTSSPEKSQSYAAQWFTMALVVLIIYISSSVRLKRKKTA